VTLRRLTKAQKKSEHEKTSYPISIETQTQRHSLAQEQRKGTWPYGMKFKPRVVALFSRQDRKDASVLLVG